MTGKKLVAQSASPDPNVYGPANAAHSIANGNAFYTGAQANDWLTVKNTLNNCLNEWNASGRDAAVAAAVSNISPTMISPTCLDSVPMLQGIQAYQPSYTMNNLQLTLQRLSDQNQTAVVLSWLQSYGMSFYIQTAMNQAINIAAQINKAGAPVPALMTQDRFRENRQPPADPGQDGGGGYNCRTDGALLLGATTAFAVLSFMTCGVVDVLAGAAWGGIALWGGLGTAGWGAGHFVAGCRF